MTYRFPAIIRDGAKVSIWGHVVSVELARDIAAALRAATQLDTDKQRSRRLADGWAVRRVGCPAMTTLQFPDGSSPYGSDSWALALAVWLEDVAK